MKAPAATGSNGNSRKMYRTLPVSMYFSFSFGNVPTVKWAQCEQVIDAYSMIVTGAFCLPHRLLAERAGLHQSPSAEMVCANARD